DLAWMASSVDFSREENIRDAERMAAMFLALDRLPVPLIGRVHGAAMGGGTGLAAVCDVVVAASDAVFGFTEVKLGLVPAVIAPFVLAKIDRSAARELFLTGARFGAGRAKEIGLAHAVVPPEDIDRTVEAYVAEILANGPEAVRTAKALIAAAWNLPPDEAAGLAAETLATRRTSAEGQEGIRAFLEKRRPAFHATLDEDRDG
ncbi:MAG: enoyl-CoA hydratase, partial [Acidobacteria bacterium]